MPIPGLKYTDEQLFQSLNVVLPAWVLLALLPTHKLTHAIVLLAVFYVCVLYTALIVPLMLSPGGADFSSLFALDGVRKLLQTPEVQLGAWAHYVAFDLWTGKWIATDAAHRGVPRILMAPVLFLTLMLGPAGLGLYFLLRTPFKPKGAASRAKPASKAQ